MESHHSSQKPTPLCLPIKSKFWSLRYPSPSSPLPPQRRPELCGCHSLTLSVELSRVYMLRYHLLVLGLKLKSIKPRIVSGICVFQLSTTCLRFTTLLQHFCDCQQCSYEHFQMCVWIHLQGFLSDRILGVEWLGHGCATVIFTEECQTVFPRGLNHFTVLTAILRVPADPHPSQHLTVSDVALFTSQLGKK